jgi:hypothetical protein
MAQQGAERVQFWNQERTPEQYLKIELIDWDEV